MEECQNENQEGASESAVGEGGALNPEENQVVSSSETDVASEGMQDAEVDALRAEVADYKNRYLRLMADFDNYKKRTIKEQSDLLRYQGEKVIVDLLEVLDNLELALSHSSAEFDKLKTGLEMVHKLFVERLAKWEVKAEPGMGNAFDPQKHNAISRVPGADAKPGTIVGELKKAYFYKDRLIRFGEVVVATEKDS
jgi:molecular chaperone GrpE